MSANLLSELYRLQGKTFTHRELSDKLGGLWGPVLDIYLCRTPGKATACNEDGKQRLRLAHHDGLYRVEEVDLDDRVVEQYLAADAEAAMDWAEVNDGRFAASRGVL